MQMTLGHRQTIYNTGNSNTSVCAKTHRKIRIPTEKYFHDGVHSENYPQKWNDRKINCFCRFAVRNNFSIGLTRIEKLCSVKLKIKFMCIFPHRKKENPDRKLFFCLSRQSCRGALTGKHCIFLSG